MDRTRVVVVLVLLLLPLGGLEARLLQLQVFNPDPPQAAGAGRRQSIQVEAAGRGRILDRRSRVLAEDVRSFDAYLVLEEYEKAAWPVAALLGLPPEEVQEQIDGLYEKIEKQVLRRPPEERRRLYSRERRTPYLLARNIPFEAALAIETSPQLHPGAVVRESLRRRYPYGAVGSHPVGYLSRITSNEAEFRELLQSGTLYEGFDEHVGQDGIAQLYRRGVFHDLWIGRAGAERSFDDDLRGGLGLLVLEREAGSSEQTVTELKPARSGADVELTLDIELQRAVEEILAGANPAAAVLLDARSGAVLALASNRGFDPNAFVPPGDPAEVRRVMADNEAKALSSRAYAQHFQPGSVFKVIASIAGLEEKKVGADDRLPCRGRYDESLRAFNCWIWNEFRGMHGEVTLRQALEQSCNCYYYEVAARCDLEPLLRWARAFGYGDRTGLDLPAEAPGRLPARRVSRHDPLSFAIGQHELMATPLQVAVMMAAVGNGGKRVVPHLRRRDPPAPVPTGASDASLAEVRQGLYDVVFGAKGTAKGTRLRDFKAAGKTGSAQAGAGRESHAWFAGYAPYDAPRVAVAVFVANSGHGGERAAPLAASILEKAFGAGY
jgi:penicillin-binding protein 2